MGITLRLFQLPANSTNGANLTGNFNPGIKFASSISFFANILGNSNDLNAPVNAKSNITITVDGVNYSLKGGDFERHNDYPGANAGFPEWRFTGSGTCTRVVLNGAAGYSLGLDGIDADGLGLLTDGKSYPILTFDSNKDLANFAAGDAIDQSDGAASGSVGSVDTVANTMTLATSTGTWDVGNTVIGPVKAVDDTTNWLVFNGNGILTDPYMQSEEPEFVQMAAGGSLEEEFKLRFPTTMVNGAAPDDILPEGTTLQAVVEARNSAGFSVLESNIIEPKLPSANVSYTMKNVLDVTAPERSFVSGDILLENLKPGTRLVVVGTNGGGNNGGPRAGTDGYRQQDGFPCAAIVYQQTRQEHVFTVTGVDGSGGITGVTKVGETYGLPDFYNYGFVDTNSVYADTYNNGSPMSDGTGTGAELRLRRGNDGVVELADIPIDVPGSGYTVGDTLTFTAPFGNGNNRKFSHNNVTHDTTDSVNRGTLDSDLDVLIHGLGGKGGDGHSQYADAPNLSGGIVHSVGGLPYQGWGTGNGVSGISAPSGGAAGGAGGVASNWMGGVYPQYTSAAKGKVALDVRKGSGGGGAGFPAGDSGNVHGSEVLYGSGSAGGGASYLNATLVPNGTGVSTTYSEVNEIEVFVGGVSQGSVAIGEMNTFELLSVPDVLFANDPADVIKYQIIKAALEAYEPEVQRRQQVLKTLLDGSVEDAEKLQTLTQIANRLSNLEADEISDDAVSSALLTLIADINTRLTALESGN